jgi:hypothetical protein
MEKDANSMISDEECGDKWYGQPNSDQQKDGFVFGKNEIIKMNASKPNVLLMQYP